MKGGRRVGKIDTRNVIAAALAACAFGGSASAQLPTGGQVVAGQATVTSTSATSLLIHTTTQNTIINFSRFSIGAGSSVSILEPNSSSILLSRVTGNVPSWLMGTLSANGRFWLVNPAGIYVGAGAHLTAAGLLLSTADITNQDFLAGNYNFGIASSNPNARIVNKGRLTATDGGAVVAAAAQVRNEGVIEADLGTVVLAGATTYTVDFAGDNLLSFAVTGAVEQVAPGTTSLVDNKGTVAAAGGRVLLTADAAKGVLDNVINTSGIVTATSVASVNGKIVLSGTGGATVVSGTLDASGKGAGETGGTVKVLSDSVTLAAGARLDASGDAGGGTVLVGGNFHGAGPERNAKATTVARGATIAADAITSGNGGRVAVWSDGLTSFAGSITARGGAIGGNGGYVETSGHDLAVASGAIVNTSAPHGKSGMWLLDPFDVLIDNSTSNASCSVGDTECYPTGSPAIIDAATLDASLTGGTSVAVFTDNISGGGGAEAGNITVAAPISWSGAATLTLEADNNVNINANITNTSGGGSLSLFAGGAITQSAGSLISLSTGGSLIMSAGSSIGASGAPINYAGGNISATTTNSGGSGIFINSSGVLTLVASLGVNGIAAEDGDIQIAAAGINVPVGMSIDSNFGNVTLTGPVTLAASTFVDAAGSIVINGSLDMADGTSVAASTGSVGITGPVTLTGSVTVSAGSNVAFGSTIDGAGSLFVGTSSGTISFGGNIGVGTPLQFIEAAGPVSIGGSGVTIVASTILFDSTVDGPGGLALNIGGSGGITFGSDIGSLSPLGSFAIAAGGDVSFNGSVTTSGSQAYDVANLCFCGGASVVAASGGSIFVFANNIQVDGSVISHGNQTYIGSSISFGGGPMVTLATSGGMFMATASGSIFFGGEGGGTFTIDTTQSGTNPPAPQFVVSGSGFMSTGKTVDLEGSINVSAMQVQVLELTSAIIAPVDIIGVSTPDPPIPPDLCVVASGTCHPDLFFFPPNTIFPPLPPPDFFGSLTGPEIVIDGGGDTPPLLVSITDIDPGDGIFFGIVPFRFGEFQDPLTFIPPVTPAGQPEPKPPTSDEPLGDQGSYIFQLHNYFLQPPGVPGVGQPASGNGNRSLWFAAPEGTQ